MYLIQLLEFNDDDPLIAVDDMLNVDKHKNAGADLKIDDVRLN